MEASKIRATADEILQATAGLPSEKAIRELLAEYVSQDSQDRRIVILADIYCCVAQDFEVSAPVSPKKGAREDKRSRLMRLPDSAPHPDEIQSVPSNHQSTACSFCELVREFYPRGKAGGHVKRVITRHLEWDHGVDLVNKRIER